MSGVESGSNFSDDSLEGKDLRQIIHEYQHDVKTYEELADEYKQREASHTILMQSKSGVACVSQPYNKVY
jgi:hypothetical protein